MVVASASRTSPKTTTVTPEQIQRILLNDGWHNVSNCEFTQFAVSPGMSPPQPNKLYSALVYTEQSASSQSGKRQITPLSKISGYNFTESYDSDS